MKTFVKTFLGICCVALVFACAKKPTESAEKVYMQNLYSDLKASFSDNSAEVMIIEDSVKVIFKNGVLFDVGESDILEGMQSNFKRFADVLNKYSSTNIIITGHTDNSGTPEGNKILSAKRAKSAWQLLADNKVDGERMTPLGQGQMIPIATNSTAEGRALNRRIEFVILYNHDRLQ